MRESCGQDKNDGEEREGGGGPFFSGRYFSVSPVRKLCLLAQLELMHLVGSRVSYVWRCIAEISRMKRNSYNLCYGYPELSALKICILPFF